MIDSNMKHVAIKMAMLSPFLGIPQKLEFFHDRLLNQVWETISLL